MIETVEQTFREWEMLQRFVGEEIYSNANPYRTTNYYKTSWNVLMKVIQKIADDNSWTLSGTIEFLNEEYYKGSGTADGLLNIEEFYKATVNYVSSNFERSEKVNRAKVSDRVYSLLRDSVQSIENKVVKLLKSNCIDFESWDENVEPMLLPKCIATAILEDESTKYACKGSASFEKRVKKEVKNIKLFI